MNRWDIQTVQQMRREGWTRDALTAAVQAGTLDRVRRGYYALPTAPSELKRAVRVGGQATGPTALPYYGIWKAPSTELFVLVPAKATRLRDPESRTQRLDVDTTEVHLLWQRHGLVRPGLLDFAPIVDPFLAVLHAVEHYSDDLAIATLDSALHERVLRPDDLARLSALLPRHRRRLLSMVDGRAEAGGESVVRYRLQLAGYRVDVQVFIRGVGRVDLVVNGRLVIEIDGRATHDTADQFVVDRRRDLELTAQHYRHLRLTYHQVFSEWPRSLAAIDAALV